MIRERISAGRTSAKKAAKVLGRKQGTVLVDPAKLDPAKAMLASGTGILKTAQAVRAALNQFAVIATVGKERFGGLLDVKDQPCALMIAHLAFAEQQDKGLGLAITDSWSL